MKLKDTMRVTRGLKNSRKFEVQEDSSLVLSKDDKIIMIIIKG
jgi:hypothetical protein